MNPVESYPTSGRLGMLTDQGDGRRLVAHGSSFLHRVLPDMFVCLTYRQTLGDVIAGLEAAGRSLARSPW